MGLTVNTRGRKELLKIIVQSQEETCIRQL